MIKKFVERWDNGGKDAFKAKFAAEHPRSYEALVKAVIEILASDNEYDGPDPERITVIDHGDYQGTMVFVVGAGGYQPSTYWATSVGYGSCSGCDTLQAISDYSDDPPTEEQLKEYADLALHAIQRMKQICGWRDED